MASGGKSYRLPLDKENTLQLIIKNVKLCALENTQEKIYCWQMKFIKLVSCLSFGLVITLQL